MDNDKNKGSFGISSDRRLRESLHAFFLSLRRTARVRQGAKYGMLAAISIACSWFALFLLDRFWETPSTARGFLSVLGWSGAVWAGYGLSVLILRLSGDSGWLARRMRQAYRAKGERMLGIIEISRERENDDSAFSPRIFEAAQERMENELHSVDHNKIFPRRMLLWPTLSLLFLAFLCAAAFWAYPGLSLNAWERWIRPWDSTERATLTLFSLPPENRFHLLEGESSVLRIPLSKESGFAPKFAVLDSPHEEPFMLRTKSNGGIYEFSIPPLS